MRLQDVLMPINELTATDDAIIRYTAIGASTSTPSSRSIKRLRAWLENPEFGDSFISGKIEGVWDEDKRFYDFIVPNRGSETVDGITFQLTQLLTYLESFFRRKRQPRDKLHTISSGVKMRMDRAIVTTISSMFPVLPIMILFFINQLLVRLGLVLLFTVLFAFVLVFGLGIDPEKTLAVTTA